MELVKTPKVVDINESLQYGLKARSDMEDRDIKKMTLSAKLKDIQLKKDKEERDRVKLKQDTVTSVIERERENLFRTYPLSGSDADKRQHIYGGVLGFGQALKETGLWDDDYGELNQIMNRLGGQVTPETFEKQGYEMGIWPDPNDDTDRTFNQDYVTDAEIVEEARREKAGEPPMTKGERSKIRMDAAEAIKRRSDQSYIDVAEEKGKIKVKTAKDIAEDATAEAIKRYQQMTPLELQRETQKQKEFNKLELKLKNEFAFMEDIYKQQVENREWVRKQQEWSLKPEAERKAELRASYPKIKSSMKTAQRQWSLVNEKLAQAIGSVNATTAGPASYTKFVPGTPAADLQFLLQTIKANIGFDKLNEMRSQSKTGGALGQVSEMENRLLQAVLGSMEQEQSPERLRENLIKIQGYLNQVIAEKEEDYNTNYSQFFNDESIGGQAISPAATKHHLEVTNPDTGELEVWNTQTGQRVR